jgi:hypothetical protein
MLMSISRREDKTGVNMNTLGLYTRRGKALGLWLVYPYCIFILGPIGLVRYLAFGIIAWNT